MNSKLFLFSMLSIIAFGCTDSNKATKKSFSNLDGYLQNEIKEGRLKGVHVEVFQEDSLVYNHHYGLRDVEAKDSMQGNEEYYIQSMTKPIVSVGLMQLYEQGKIKLDDPIDKYLPEFKNVSVVNDPTVGSKSGSHPAKTPITIRAILSHTAGLSHGISPIAYDSEIMAAAFNPNIKHWKKE